MYLSALIRKMKSTSTLANPVTLYRLANDATKALTVDPGLDSIPKLIGLASDLNKVPTKRITFVTMPTVPYPGNPTAWLSPAMPAAQQLFNDMITDTPLSRAARHLQRDPDAEAVRLRGHGEPDTRRGQGGRACFRRERQRPRRACSRHRGHARDRRFHRRRDTSTRPTRPRRA